jgi:hypothetical protein
MSQEKPRFRRDLEAVPMEADGERYVEVRDVEAGWSYCFYDFEYRVALALDGLAWDKVIPWVKLSTGLELQVDQLRAFAERLQEMGFLEGESGEESASHHQGAASGADALMDVAASGSAAAAAAPDENALAKATEQSERVAEAVVAADAPPAADGAPSVAEALVVDDGADVPTADEVVMEDVALVAGEVPDQPAAEASSEPPLSPAAASPFLAELGSQPESLEPSAPQVQPEPPQVGLSSDLLEPSQDGAVPQAEVMAAPATLGEASVDPVAASPAIVATDSTAFPVLPAPAPRSPALEAVPPEVVPASVPPPWNTPRPLMTPVPVTFGPIVEGPASRRRVRRSMVLFGSLGVLAAVAMLALVLPFLFSPQAAPKPQVRTLAAAPGTIFRYFDGAGVVTAVPGLTLKFPASGKVIRMASVGSAVAAGDIAAALEAARPWQEQLTRQRERLAFYQQMAEAMHQVGNTQEEEKQAAKVELRNERIAKTLRALAEVAVVMDAPGVVEETFAREGDTVAAGSPALRLHAAGFRAAFEFSRQQTASARRLGFCQVEAEGYLFDCVQIPESTDETHVVVEIAAVPPSLAGKTAHLARARFERAFVVPLTAIVHSGSRDEVLMVSRQSRIEPRAVTVAERDASEAIVVQGLDEGDNLVLEAAPGLRAGAQVVVLP